MTTAYLLTGSSFALIALSAAGINGWRRLVDFHDQHTDRPGVHPIRPHRRPIAAITATPHWPVIDDDLGPLTPGPLEPARIHDQLIGAGL